VAHHEQPDPRSIHDLTARYESWLGKQTRVVKSDIDIKHSAMCESPFVFLRATYYAWAVMWPAALPDLADAPRVTAVGDLHYENFGTWRDAEGRLAWGINDFDEAATLPYTNDLVRLATSASLAYGDAQLQSPAADLAEAFLEGYVSGLRDGGKPVLFAERNMAIGMAVLRALLDQESFWNKKLPKKGEDARRVPPDCRKVLTRALPPGTTNVHLRKRQAGKGSLGRQRFVAMGIWNGGRVAREAKAVVPSAALWASGVGSHRATRGGFERLLRASIRSRDPFLGIVDGWVVRRLAPDSDKIDVEKLGRGLELELADLMGREIANVHLATPGAAKAILSHLSQQRSNWLVKAARIMAGVTADSHRAWEEAEGSFTRK
jgi:hypothetical protein